MAADRRRVRARLRAGLGGVRFRTTLAAVLVVGVALVAGAVVVLALMRSALLDNLQADAELRASGIAERLEAGASPAAVVGHDVDEGNVWVLGPGGEVLAAGGDDEGGAPVTGLAPGESARVGSDDEALAVAVDAETGRGELTVVVARSTEDVLESTGVVRNLLTVSIPVLLLVVGGTTWAVVGRALRPVEAIRTEVEAISSTALHRRVPTPRGQDEIARLASTMNGMLARVEEGQARQRRFVADASHELRSPVATLRQHAEVARAHPDRGSLPDLTETVLAESVRMQQLVDEMLMLAGSDEHSLQLRRKPVDLDDLVLDEIRRLRRVTGHRVDGSGVSAARVAGDETALARVVRNLGDNAARHARTTVACGLVEADGVALLTVEDDGPGIPPEERPRVFERFVRLDEGRARDEGGSGLGLAIVAELVAAHGGDVVARASDLGGSCLEVRVPVPGDDEHGTS